MNANELAEGINSPHNACCYRDKCRQQQAEIEALKAIINEAFKSIPAMGEDGEFYHEHHGMDGEYLGYENIPANYVVQVIEAILRKAHEK